MGFRQEVPSIRLSVEQGTERVPDDGRYHLMHDGTLGASFGSKSAALKSYRAARDQLLAAAGSSVQTPPADVAAALKKQMAEGEYGRFRGSLNGARQKLRVGARRGHR
jgi:hypothetical protein